MNNAFALPPNISGFTAKKSKQLQVLEVNDLQNFCEVACEGQKYEFIRFIDLSAQKNRSYHLCMIAKDQQEYLIFLNKYHKVIAFSKLLEPMPSDYMGTTEMPRNEYIDLPDLHQAFADNYLVLPAHILLLPLDSDIPESAAVVQNLQDAEFGEFSYWVPQTIGQVVFNGWEKN